MIGKRMLTPEPTIYENCVLQNVSIGQWTEVGPHNVWENVEFGDFSYTSGFNQIQNASIGKFVNIAAGVRIGPVQHPLERPTLHHFTYRRRIYGFADTDDLDFFRWREEQKVIIGHDVWLGHNAIIMPGVKIGNGSVVGSGAVVTRDVAPYAIVAGVPAKVIRERFSPEIVHKMQKIQWWDWPYEVFKERWRDFLLEAADFVHKYDKDR
ncbi:MAG: DapH/DapD/GlmU-related protein [Bacillota bacterium]|uniref:Chloramphenicol acetyltransferase n=1 Tax=Thermanaerosceptrum fracticalcis TaxID=1712410 RepID=A0A7G6DYT0_THEFR|nr:DapH/DapD/GlmU-related protein [Thermanaerosceptrum fracticalcis]QNB44984.1 chloramphenicol acetyltransferase [Thermanaerosceptrum fracticalcis]